MQCCRGIIDNKSIIKKGRNKNMKIAVIGAMEEEVELLRAALNDAQSTTIAGSEYTTGTYEGKEVVLLKSGIGKVNVCYVHDNTFT